MKKITLNLLVISLFALVAFQGKAQDTAYIKSVIELSNSTGNYEKGIADLNIQLKKYPKSAEVNTALGELYYFDQQFEFAGKHYQAAKTLDPKMFSAHVGLIKVAYASGKAEEVKIAIEKALEQFPKSGELYTARGQYKIETGLNISGLQDFNKAISLDPGYPNAYYNRAAYYSSNGDFAKSTVDLLKFIELSPDAIEGVSLLVDNYLQMDKTGEAEQVMNNYLKNNPGDIEAHKIQSEILFTQGKFSEAEAVLRNGVTLEPKDAELFYLLANTQYKLEQLEDACTSFQNSLEILEQEGNDTLPVYAEMQSFKTSFCNQNSLEYYYQRGIAAYNLKNLDKALEWYEKGIAAFPNNSLIYTFKGNALLEAKKYNEAIEAYKISNSREKAMKEEFALSAVYGRTEGNTLQMIVATNMHTNYNQIANAFVSLHQPDSALVYFRKAITITNIAPEFEGLSESQVGLVLMDLHKYAEAQKSFEASAKKSPQNPDILVLLAISQFAQSFDKPVQSNQFTDIPQVNLVGFSLPLKAKLKNRELLLKAKENLDKALQLDDKLPNGNYLKGCIEYYTGTEACKYWRTATELMYPVPLEYLKKCAD